MAPFLLAMACVVTVPIMQRAWPQHAAEVHHEVLRQTHSMTAIAFGLMPAELHQPPGPDVKAPCRLPQPRLTQMLQCKRIQHPTSMHVKP